METWQDALDIVKNTEMKSRIIKVSTKMESFEFFFGFMLGETILSHSDNLSRTLQSSTISAAGQGVAAITVANLENMRNNPAFDLLWGKVTTMASTLGISEPQLPRQRRVPRRYEPGQAQPEYPSTPSDYYRLLQADV